jgi:DNA-binding response OmpR family regulator
MAAFTGIAETGAGIRNRVPEFSEVADKGNREGASRIEAGDFSLDLNARSVTVCGRALRLSGAEFDVLVFLMSHRRHIVTSRTRLKTRIPGGVREMEFLRAFISLQKKLREEVPGSHYLQTESWILYDFHPGA